MAENIFTPFKGMQGVSFGMRREAVRNYLGNNFEVFLRNEFAQNTGDYYKDLGLFVLYDSDDICNAIEFTTNSNVSYKGENLLSLSFNEIINSYRNESTNYEEDEFGIVYYDLGFGVSKQYEEDIVESVIIFSRNYWG